MNKAFTSNNKKDFAAITEEEDYALTNEEKLDIAAAHPRRTLLFFFAMVLECFIPAAFRK